jgi:hypothetical protein
MKGRLLVPKDKVDLADRTWKELKRRCVDEWEPTEEDVSWLIKTVESLKVGGKWTMPAGGVTFEKVGADHLRLESMVTKDPLNSMIAIEKTKKVGEKATIKVDIEKAADFVLFHA